MICMLIRNGESWCDLRGPVQKLLMRPRAAADYLPAQNAVADDFLNLLQQSLDGSNEVPDFFQAILKYTMECMFNFFSTLSTSNYSI